VATHYPSSYCQAQNLGEEEIDPAYRGTTLILLLDHSSQASQNLHQTYPLFVMEDAEDQTSAGFVVKNVWDQAYAD